MFVYSIVAKSTFTELADIHQQLDRVRDGEPVPLLLLGNKCDLDDRRVVSKESGRDLAAQWGAMFGECSAKTGDGITAAFVQLLRRVIADRTDAAAKAALLRKGKTRRAQACTVL